MDTPTIFFPSSFLRIEAQIEARCLPGCCYQQVFGENLKKKCLHRPWREILSLIPAPRMGWSLDTRTCSHKMSLSQIRLLSWKVGPAYLPPQSTRTPFFPHPHQNMGGGLSFVILSLLRGGRVRHLTHCSECLGCLEVPLVCAPIVTEPFTFRVTLFYTKLARYIPPSISPSWPSSWPKNQWSPEAKSSNVVDITIPGEHSDQQMEVKSHRFCYARKHSFVAQESWRNQAHIAYIKDLRDS